jgi:hypothetical protein
MLLKREPLLKSKIKHKWAASATYPKSLNMKYLSHGVRNVTQTGSTFEIPNKTQVGCKRNIPKKLKLERYFTWGAKCNSKGCQF